jgi:1-phosphofructokinase family hexose kinase
MGGKPTDASWILGELGIPSLALGFAAGTFGQKVEAMLRARGVITDFIQVGGETRLSTIIVAEDSPGQTTITTATLDVSPQHIAALTAKYEHALDGATCIVLGGTLPRGVEASIYPEYIEMARARSIPVVFDAVEPYLSAGICAHPTVVKPNRAELSGLAHEKIDSLGAAYRAGRAILERFGVVPVITLDTEGGLAVLPDRAYRIPPLNVNVVSASGTGDAVLAGLAAAFHRNQPIEEGLRLGFAAAAAVLLQPGTADCRREDVENFLPQIELIPYP